ncbi:carbohydrate ABC transporter permease [Robinsoniella sp. KNHs210]|uniref:carbohydrate ABC transporter permease n=1 Tax=Robinsoniella sp. KNHs210 TaxID=1469950 RepID=UPI0005C7C64F|nr:sugar ABC transporter permease [Robinsoniella sp. KNHs210]
MNSKREKIYGVFATIPALILFLIFTYIPLLMTLGYSVTDWNGFSKNFNFVGIDNFVQVFKDTEVLQTFGNTMYFTVLVVVIGLALQLMLAIFLFEKLKGRNVLRAIIYAPCIISPVIVSLTWVNFFQYAGIINEVLSKLGLEGLRVDWLGDVSIVKNVLIFINTWQWAGYGMIIFMTGLSSISKDVYEAGMLDGACGFKKFRYITLPLLMPSVTVNVFISITGALRLFDLPFVMTGGGPINASKTISMTIYDNAFLYERFGYSSAIGVIFFLIIATVTVIQLKITRSREVEY